MTGACPGRWLTMNTLLISVLILSVTGTAAACWVCWQLLWQNGRILLRLEAMEKKNAKAESGKQKTEIDQSRPGSFPSAEAVDSITPSETTGSAGASAADERAGRFSNRSLAGTKIKRNGLKPGTVAPEFRLPRLDGGELALSELRGRLVLLVFSSPRCGPCNALAPKLEKFHRKFPLVELVMISQGEPEENRAKAKGHGLTFTIVLQKQWEVSREYAFFATPLGYLIDESGLIAAEAALGVDGVANLLSRVEWMLHRQASARQRGLFKRLADWPMTAAEAALRQIDTAVTVLHGKLKFLQLKHLKFVPRPDDIFIVTYPRSGTTWMQMILYQLTSDGNMDIAHIAQHCPWFERSLLWSEGYEHVASPRIFKTHLPYSKVPKGTGRYIYVMRDGADVAVSYYNLYRNYNQYKGTFEEFFERFMRGKVQCGSWFEHVEGWRKHRNRLNVLFLTYEELSRDLESCVRRIITFCGFKVPEERIPPILERCSFAFMKEHESKFDPALETLWENGTRLNSFLRAGQAGSGARELTRAQGERFNQVLGGYPAINGPHQAPPAREELAAQAATGLTEPGRVGQLS